MNWRQIFTENREAIVVLDRWLGDAKKKYYTEDGLLMYRVALPQGGFDQYMVTPGRLREFFEKQGVDITVGIEGGRYNYTIAHAPITHETEKNPLRAIGVTPALMREGEGFASVTDAYEVAFVGAFEVLSAWEKKVNLQGEEAENDGVNGNTASTLTAKGA